MQLDSLNHFKSVAAHQFFVAPADRDYLIARWLLLGGFPELFWHVAQAVEKYLKAGLVLNGEKVDGASHDLRALHERHVAVFGDLAFRRFERPDGLDPEMWRDEPVEAFVGRVSFMGSPDGRYGLASWWRQPDDLFKIDQMCWALRRVTIGLDWMVGEDFERLDAALEPHRGRRYGEVLLEEPELAPRGEFRDLEQALPEVGSDRGDLLHAWNFAFRRCPADIFKPAPGLVAPPIGPAGNSYMFIFW